MAAQKAWDRFNQMPPGRDFEAYHFSDQDMQPMWYHNHPHYEFFFFVQGHNHIVVEGVDLKPVKGDAFIYPPGVMHRNVHLDAQIPYERFYLFVRREFLQAISAPDYDIPSTIEHMTRNDQYYFHLNEDDLQALIHLTDQVIKGSDDLRPAEQFINRHRMSILLVQALTTMTNREAMPQSEDSKRMSSLIHYINQHAMEPLSLEDIASVFYTNKFSLLRDFKEYTGITIHQYLIIRRILKAQEWIRQGMKPKEVSQRSGFSDYSSFYRAFKARTGLSPEQYRQAAKP